MAVEVLPGTDHPEIMMPVHQHCLVDAGGLLDRELRAGRVDRRWRLHHLPDPAAGEVQGRHRVPGESGRARLISCNRHRDRPPRARSWLAGQSDHLRNES